MHLLPGLLFCRPVSVPRSQSAVKAITNVREEVEKAFSGVPVKLTFTSNIIRIREAPSPMAQSRIFSSGIRSASFMVSKASASFLFKNLKISVR